MYVQNVSIFGCFSLVSAWIQDQIRSGILARIWIRKKRDANPQYCCTVHRYKCTQYTVQCTQMYPLHYFDYYSYSLRSSHMKFITV
jgi:hypothetical protein